MKRSSAAASSIRRCLALFFAASLAAGSAAKVEDWDVKEWDVIVVGAGPAGIIAAERMAEAGKTTLLLEYGGASYGITGMKEKPDWMKETTMSRVDVPGLYKSIFSEKSSMICPEEHVHAFQACAIGGNSAINAGVYLQPPASDWDDFHPGGWKSGDVQAATDRLLARQPAVEHYSTDEKFYLQSGYEAARDWIVGAASFNDVSIKSDPNNKAKSFGRPVYNYINGTRGGPVRTYLHETKAMPHFHLQKEVKVQHIVQEAGKASAVVAQHEGKEITVKLSKKGRVILSAGALNSPQLLMYSGIGPRDLLANLSKAEHTPYADEAKWVVNEEVGKGLFDNPNTFVMLSGPTIESYTHNYKNPVPEDRDAWLKNKSGPYTFASQTSMFWDYIQHEDGTRTGVQGTIDSSGYSDFTDNNTITLNVYGTSGMLSSGRVLLAGDNFTAEPSSDVYYSNDRDAMSIAKFIHNIFQALPESTPEEPAKEGLTPLNIPRKSSVEEIHKYITTWSPYAVGSVQHWSSSCRIGKCVDENTKVIGTKNIHVVDGSIVSPLTVNPQFGIMVAAEKAVENILAFLPEIEA